MDPCLEEISPLFTLSPDIMPQNVYPPNHEQLRLVTEFRLAAYPPHTVVTMPALSPTMTSGNIGTWQKNAGDTIAPGDVLVEIETDKAQMDFEFQEDGVLAKILKEAGEKDVAVGNVSQMFSYIRIRSDCLIANCGDG